MSDRDENVRHGWTEAELSASVEAYETMFRLHAEKRSYSKKEFYKKLASRFGRTEKAFEYRLQNISYVLDTLRRPWLPGLRPAGHVGANIRTRLVKLLEDRQQTAKAYDAKLPAMREWLVEVASRERKVTYGELMEIFDIDRFNLQRALSALGRQSEKKKEPILTALVVLKSTGHSSSGLESEFHVRDDEQERAQLYRFWAEFRHQRQRRVAARESLDTRCAKFALVETRPAQAAFRRNVFNACAGACVISGCEVVPALDAAHRIGRSWRLGHNEAEDGFLLRKDLHALYDALLLRISEKGNVQLHPSVREHYKELLGARVRVG